MKELQSDNSIKIAKADKGNAAVVIDSEEYERKVQEHLDDQTTYKKLNYNYRLYGEQYKILFSNKLTVPKFYAIIKIHKENNPIRPIASFIDSPTYKLS